MPIAEEVKVVLTADNTDQIKKYEQAQAAYTGYIESVGKTSKEGTAFIAKAEKGRIDVAKRSSRGIKKYNEIMSRSYRSETGKQADAVDDSTRRIAQSLKEQRDQQARTSESAGKMSGLIRKAIAPLAAVFATTAVAGFVKDSLAATQAIEQQSQIAGVTAERYQELTFAAERYGVSQEKVSDVLKDTSDKFGDFFNTGAGPLVDFFDTIAPKAGLTAESFRDLSSDQALGLFVKALEDVGANEQDVTFFMESLASDSKALLPLFKNNGKAVNEMAEELRGLGGVIDNDAIAKGAEASRTLDRLGDTIRLGLRTAIVELAPDIEALAENIIGLMPTLVQWAQIAVREITGLADRYRDILNLKPLDSKDADENIKRLEEIAKLADTIEATGGAQSSLNQLPFVQEQIFDALGKDQVKAIEERGGSIEKALRDEAARLAGVAADIRRKSSGDDEFDLRDLLSGANKPTSTGIFNPNKAKDEQNAASAKARLDRELAVIAELGRSEKEQIQAVLAARLESIDKSNRAEAEKATLRMKANDAAISDLARVEKAETDAINRAAEEQAQLVADEFQASQDKQGFIAEIAAATARMNGRALDAVQIELDATRARYEAELAFIDEVIAKKGSTPQLEADRANAEAGLASTEADEARFQRDNLEGIQGISDGAEAQGFEAELERLNAAQQAKLEALEEFRSTDLELQRAFELEKLQIEEEFNAKRNQVRLASLNAQLDAATTITSNIGKIGKQGSKAQEAAAKVEKGIAIGRIAVSTAVGVAKALEGPFPLNLINAAVVGVAGAAQGAAVASQGFKDGVVDLKGPGTTTSDSIPANLSRGESVIRASATRGNEAGLRGLNAGLSPEQAFGLPNIQTPNIARPNVSVPRLNNVSNNSTQTSFRGGDFVVQGNVDATTADRVMAEFEAYKQTEAARFRAMSDLREKNTTPRSERARIGRR